MCQEYPAYSPTRLPLSDPVRRVPLGGLGGIVPWNFPALLAAEKSIPALLVGDSIRDRSSAERHSRAPGSPAPCSIRYPIT
ncbi:aldehyde dehydrogenase family protein [Streptomyces sp. NPDC002643]